MPCKKCKDENYKWGNTGECKYATKDECEKANPKKYSKMKNIPSPIGKKTYEEYAKELKEYNLSEEPKLEKIELSLISDMNKSRKDVSDLAQTVNKLWIKVSEDTAKQYLDLQDLWDNWRETSKKAGTFKPIVDKLENQESDVQSTLTVLNKKTTELIGYIRKAKEASKELGIDVRDMSGYGEAVDIGNNSVSILSKIEDDTTTTRSLTAMNQMIKDITS